MRDSARLPEATRFAATSYSFSVKLKDGSNAKAMRARPFDALRLVWHDYPGDWFEQDVSGPEEAQRRVDTFRSLLVSDVALVLVDGQRLLDNVGEEERYLKSLLTISAMDCCRSRMTCWRRASLSSSFRVSG